MQTHRRIVNTRRESYT